MAKKRTNFHRFSDFIFYLNNKQTNKYLFGDKFYERVQKYPNQKFNVKI